MKFGALVYKEIRECLPFAIGAAILFIICGFASVQISIRPEKVQYNMLSFIRDREYSSYYWEWILFSSSLLQPAGIFLIIFSVLLGIAVGIRQFLAESFTRTWGFILHHSITRGTVLFAKLFTGLISFIPLVILWLLLYVYAHNKQYFPIPPAERIFSEGLIFISFGYVAYLSIAMASLNKAKWYTTKVVSIAFGIWMFVTLCNQWKINFAWAAVLCACAILLLQITDTFLNREFD